MKNNNLRLLLMLTISFMLNHQASAYDLTDNKTLIESSKNDLLMVVGGGVAGAVLGLSTLSFTEEPQDNLNNIMYGAAIGIIAGVIYVAYQQATVTKRTVRENYSNYSAKEMSTNDRIAWHQNEQVKILSAAPKSQAGWSFQF